MLQRLGLRLVALGARGRLARLLAVRAVAPAAGLRQVAGHHHLIAVRRLVAGAALPGPLGGGGVIEEVVAARALLGLVVRHRGVQRGLAIRVAGQAALAIGRGEAVGIDRVAARARHRLAAADVGVVERGVDDVAGGGAAAGDVRGGAHRLRRDRLARPRRLREQHADARHAGEGAQVQHDAGERSARHGAPS